MAICKKDSKLWKETNKVLNRWEKSKTLADWNLNGDMGYFEKLFFDATNKDFAEGIDINFKDMRKMDYKLKEQIRHLESPSDYSSKF